MSGVRAKFEKKDKCTYCAVYLQYKCMTEWKSINVIDTDEDNGSFTRFNYTDCEFRLKVQCNA